MGMGILGTLAWVWVWVSWVTSAHLAWEHQGLPPSPPERASAPQTPPPQTPRVSLCSHLLREALALCLLLAGLAQGAIFFFRLALR